MKSYLYNSDEMIELKNEINKLTKLIDSEFIISQEGFGNIVKKVLTSIVDRIFLHINTVFKNTFSLFNIAGIFNTLVINSPIEDFLSKHKTKSLILFSEKNIHNYTKIYIPKPRGMIASYHEVLSTHDRLLKSLNMIPFIKATNNDLQILFETITKKESTQEIVSNKIAEVVKTSTVNEKTLLTLAKEHDKQFSGDPTKAQKVLFPNEFKTVKDFKTYCDETIDLFGKLKSTKKVYEEYSAQSLYIRKLIDKIEENEQLLNRESLKHLVEYFQYIATCYQLFGTLAVSQLAIENNLVITLNEMLQLTM